MAEGLDSTLHKVLRASQINGLIAQYNGWSDQINVLIIQINSWDHQINSWSVQINDLIAQINSVIVKINRRSVKINSWNIEINGWTTINSWIIEIKSAMVQIHCRTAKIDPSEAEWTDVPSRLSSSATVGLIAAIIGRAVASGDVAVTRRSLFRVPYAAVAARFDVVIPARNEASTVAGVVRAALGAAGVGTVFVVDDGSRDGTAMVARRAGARVVSVVESNAPGHKGRALAAGVAASNAEVLVFFDADLSGVLPEHFEELAAPVLDGPFALSCGVLSYGPLRDPLFLRLPPITGLRALRRQVFEAVDLAHSRGFQIEILMNEVVVRHGWPSSIRSLGGLHHRTKVAKRGWRRGLAASLAMWGDLLACLRIVPPWTYPAYLRGLTLLPPVPQVESDSLSIAPASDATGEASSGSAATP